jgi:protein-disulfide isomerase
MAGMKPPREPGTRPSTDRPVIAALSLLLALIATGCRDPLLEGAPWTPDASDFDASVEDDAGPGELCPAGTKDLFNNAYSNYIGGEESVELTVSNFSYFRCPHCAHFAELSRGIWAARPDFRKRVRLYFHHYPFDNQTAWQLHACAEAAGRQGMEHFWAVHDLLYDGMNADDQKIYSVEEVVEFVDDVLGLDMDQFNADRESDIMLSFLSWDKSQAQAVGVTGTPSVFICGEKIGWSSIEEVVDGYLYP